MPRIKQTPRTGKKVKGDWRPGGEGIIIEDKGAILLIRDQGEEFVINEGQIKSIGEPGEETTEE